VFRLTAPVTEFHKSCLRRIVIDNRLSAVVRSASVRSSLDPKACLVSSGVVALLINRRICESASPDKLSPEVNRPLDKVRPQHFAYATVVWAKIYIRHTDTPVILVALI